MQTATIEFDRTEAQAAYKLYREHRGAHTKEDAEISRIYYQIAKGGKVIRAHESIRAAGLDADGLPKLAMIRADVKRIVYKCGYLDHDRAAVFMDAANPREMAACSVKCRWSGIQDTKRWRAEAMVPMIPVHLRPSDALDKYHILWEADWKKVPVDPMLLKRLSGDAWLVVAAWDLTAVEQAVLAGRL